MHRITRQTIRDNFQDQGVSTWTLAEAATSIGRSIRTIEDMWRRYRIRQGRSPWLRGCVIGPFSVDRKTFEQFVRTGIPQGEDVPDVSEIEGRG